MSFSLQEDGGWRVEGREKGRGGWREGEGGVWRKEEGREECVGRIDG